MRKQSNFFSAAMSGALVLILSLNTAIAQSAKAAASSISFTPDVAKKELAVGFRLVDDVDVTSVQATADGNADSLITTWEAWSGDKAQGCAWMIVIDTSNPARAKTIGIGVEFIRSFVIGLQKQDAASVFTLSRDLFEVSSFGDTPEDRSAGLAAIKPAGDASLTTLLHTNLREGLQKLADRKEPRKALLVLTDGKDETPGGAEAQEIEKKKLVEAATAAGVVIHSIGYAESADDQKYFAALKDVSAQTSGLFEPASLASKDLPSGFQTLLRGVMHGAGVARIDLSKLTEPVSLTITAKTAAGKTVTIQVPKEKVAEAIPHTTPEAKAEKEKQEAEAKAKAEKEKQEAEAKAKAEKEKQEAEAKAKAEKERQEAEAKAKAEKEKQEAKKKADKAKKQKWILIGAGSLLVLLLAVSLMIRASRRRAAEEARLSIEARMAAELAEQEARLAEARRAEDETKKIPSPPLAWLEMCDAQQTRHPVRITSLKIGRGQHNDFVLRNDSVSGNHCVLNCNREGEWSITDLNSGNGVVLNGSQVKQAVLHHGDTIELGELKMRFLLRA